MLLLAMLAMVAAQEAFLRGEPHLADDALIERKLGETDFAWLKAYYNAKEKKCTLTYKVEGKGEETIDFGDYEEDGDEVVCKEKEEPTSGVYLPVDETDFNAKWINEKGKDVTVKYERFTWKKGSNGKKYAWLKLRREKEESPDEGPMDENGKA